MKLVNTDKRTTKIGFLLLNNFTMIALSAAVEPLRMANQLSGKELYTWKTISYNDNVMSSNGCQLVPDERMSAACDDYDVVIVVGGVDIVHGYSKHEQTWIKSLDRKHITIGGICTGAYFLADAGLLNDQSCSAHWECIAALKESFPRVNCNSKLFTISENRLTASGGVAPTDMMLHYIGAAYGSKLSNAIANMFVCERVRSTHDQQRVPLRHFLNITQPKLIEIVELMEANIEEPLDLEDLAAFAEISRRQQERLFHKYLGCPPSRYYLKLRLEKARQLLKQSMMSIIEISYACGFVSPAHFSRCYRKHIGSSPREERMGIQESANDSVLHADTHVAHESANPSLHNAKYEPSYASINIL